MRGEPWSTTAIMDWGIYPVFMEENTSDSLKYGWTWAVSFSEALTVQRVDVEILKTSAHVT